MTDERPTLGGRGKALLALGVLLALGLLVLGLAGLREKRRRERFAALLDAAPPPHRLDDAAWETDQVLIVKAAPERYGAFAFAELVHGEGARCSDEEAARFLLDDSRRRVHDAGPRRTATCDRVLALRPRSRDWRGPDAAFAVIESSVVYAFHDGSHGPRVRRDTIGVYPCGSEAEVRERIRHVVALRAAFDEAKKHPSPAALEPFVTCRVKRAQLAAVGALTECGDAAVPLLRLVLEEERCLALHAEAVDVLAAMGTPLARDELASHLARELVYWRRLAPQLGPSYMQAASDEVWAHHVALCATLEGIARRGDSRPRACVKEFLALAETLPPNGYERLEEATNTVRKWLEVN